MTPEKKVAHEFTKALSKSLRASVLDADNILWRWVGDDYIGKPAVQMKDLSHKWVEEAIKTPELIDSTFYNLDGSRKTDEEIKINLGIKYPAVKFTGI